MSEWTPDTDEVRGMVGQLACACCDNEERREAFDRWLRKVQALAWAEGHAAGQEDAPCYDVTEPTRNPYREKTP